IADKAYFVENGSLIQIAPKNRQFTHKKPYQKFLTLFAGPLFNFLLTLVLFIGLAYYQGTPTYTLDKVAQDSPAAHARVKPGDTIVKTAHKHIKRKSDIDQAISQVNDKKTHMKAERDRKTDT